MHSRGLNYLKTLSKAIVQSSTAVADQTSLKRGNDLPD
jgi:hypothetical protein